MRVWKCKEVFSLKTKYIDLNNTCAAVCALDTSL